MSWSRATRRRHGRFDWLGALVAALAVGGLSFGLIRGQERGWSDPVAVVALVTGVIAVVTFPILMTRRPDPLVPLGPLPVAGVRVINLATFFIYGALYSTSGTSVFLQGVLGYTALGGRRRRAPRRGAADASLSTRVGTVAGRVGARPFLVVGPLLMAAG